MFYRASLILLALLLTAAAATLPAGAREGRVRVTTGSYTVSGWEHGLVSGNRNLGHFTWVPITSFVQGTKKVSQIKGPDLEETQYVRSKKQRTVVFTPTVARKSVYIKPIHIPTVLPRDSGNTAIVLDYKDVAARVSRPAPAPVRTDVSAKLAAGKSCDTVQGKLAARKSAQAVQARLMDPPEIAVCPSYAVADTGYFSTLSDTLEHKNVLGRVQTKGCRSF